MQTLRSRFVLSHVLPLLLVIPLVGLTLIYVLETRVFLAAIAGETVQQAELIAALADDPLVWRSPAAAQRFVDGLDARALPDILLVDAAGQPLAFRGAGEARPDLTIAEWEALQAGEGLRRTHYGPAPEGGQVVVWVPVGEGAGAVWGALRLTRSLGSLEDDLLQLRYWIAAILLGALVVGSGVGTLLALSLERPLAGVTRAMQQLTSGERLDPLPERGPVEIRLLLAAVNTLVRRLHTLETARRQLLANLVHELGRPLGAMRQATHALRIGAFDDPAFRADLLDGIAGEIQRLDRLLDTLAALHDRVLGPVELDRRPLTLKTWLPGVLAPWQASAMAKPLHWRLDLPHDLPPLYADPDLLGQVLGNLLSNAIKYTPAGGAVTVAVGEAGDEVWIRVTDTGPGIAPDEQARIFEAFYRSRVLTRFPQGLGLGLTIAQDIAIAHGGRLTVTSEPGAGSQFTLYLPRVESPPIQPPLNSP